MSGWVIWMRNVPAAIMSALTALRRMIERHGTETVSRYGRALLDYCADRSWGTTHAAIPAGEYQFEDALYDDGPRNGPIPIGAV